MIDRTTLFFIFALALASGAPPQMAKRTKSGVPLFLVTDFQIIERFADDATSSSEEFSGNASAADAIDRNKRETAEKITFPKSLFEYMSNTLAHRIRYPEEFDQMKKAKLTNRLQKSYIEEDYTDNHLRIMRSVRKDSPVEPAIFPHEEYWAHLSVMESWIGHGK